NYAYVVNEGNQTVIQCTVGAGGALTGCGSTGSGFSNPYGITLSPDGSQVYVANFSNPGGAAGTTVTQCSVGATTGALTCGAAYAPTGLSLNGPWEVALSADDLYAYVTNFSNSTVYQCSVDATTRVLSNCANTATGTGFSSPTGILFN
ncbi:MAG TPA: hypothetical protein VN617_11965, partial [Rhodoferax sp.]|nr:hypothetical protein [Rhodoferax sp.]